MISPPRVLLIGITAIITFVAVATNYLFPSNFIYSMHGNLWLIVFMAVVIAFVLSIPAQFYNKSTFKALLSLPKAFMSMFLSLFKLKGANKKFIHTQHGTIENK